MNIERRRIHPEQRATNPSLMDAQRRLLWEQWSNDVEIYDDAGNLVAITARDNPNISQILTNLGLDPNANGGTQ